MTIKQQGGIFGRNPSFNDVEVDGTLSTDSFTLDGTAVTATGAELNYLDITTLGRGQASKAVTADASGNVFLGNKTALSDVNAGHAFAQGGNSGLGYSARDGLIHSYNQLGSGGQTIRFLYQGSAAGYIDVYNTYATFRPSNGGGIDFSATSGTGTSELFDDYEEGTWSPVYIPQIGSFATMTMSVSEAKYTKIGRFVYIQASILTNNVDTTGASGGLRLSGFPFSSSGFGSFIVSYAQNWGGDVPLYGYIENGTTYANLRYRTSVNGADSSMLVGDLTTGAVASQNYMIVSGVYTVA